MLDELVCPRSELRGVARRYAEPALEEQYRRVEDEARRPALADLGTYQGMAASEGSRMSGSVNRAIVCLSRVAGTDCPYQTVSPQSTSNDSRYLTAVFLSNQRLFHTRHRLCVHVSPHRGTRTHFLNLLFLRMVCLVRLGFWMLGRGGGRHVIRGGRNLGERSIRGEKFKMVWNTHPAEGKTMYEADAYRAQYPYQPVLRTIVRLDLSFRTILRV